MPVLPSGRYVDIMSERARFHAARRRLRVSESTPYHQLYPLIDILVGRNSEAETSGSGYGFSGYTLADTWWLNQWEERDRAWFLDWLRQPEQIRNIELARRRLLAEKTIPKEQVYPYPKRLYSRLQQRVSALPLKRAEAGQWRRTLLNMRREGIRQEELTWSGGLDFLSRQPVGLQLDKAVVLEAIDFSAIRPRLSTELQCDNGCRLSFSERAQRLPAYQLRLAGYEPDEGDIGVIRFDSERNYRIGRIWPQGRSLNSTLGEYWFVLGPYGQAIVHPTDRSRRLFASAQTAMEVASQHALRSHRLRCDLAYSACYEYMTLAGGESYREWLVTLPEYHRSHFNGHFFERNILLHLRTKVRRSEEGWRVLFIEELQSDWHQAAAHHRKRVGVPPAPFRREWVSLALKLMLQHVVASGLDGIAWANATVHQQRYDRVMPPLRRLYDEAVPQALNRLAAPWQVTVGQGRFVTRQPWLHAERNRDLWKVTGGAGKFATRSRYDKQQAIALIERHSKAVTLTLPMLSLPAAMRNHIAENGLPLFGERLD